MRSAIRIPGRQAPCYTCSRPDEVIKGYAIHLCADCRERWVPEKKAAPVQSVRMKDPEWHLEPADFEEIPF